jgi:hypothetical protein
MKLNFAIGHGLALKELLSRCRQTDRQTDRPYTKPHTGQPRKQHNITHDTSREVTRGPDGLSNASGVTSSDNDELPTQGKGKGKGLPRTGHEDPEGE